MKKTLTTLALALVTTTATFAQVGIGTKTPAPSAVLELSTTTKGFLPPRVNTTQRDAIASPPAGLVVYNTTTNRLEFSDGTSWVNLVDGSVITAVNATANSGSGGVAIGTNTPNAASILDLTATNKGFLPPRMTTAQRGAISSPATGLTIYNTTVGCLQYFNNTGWVNACNGSISITPGPLSDCSTPGFIAPFITAAQTEVVDVTIVTANGTQTWMDRNLGAITVARSVTDCYAYGNLYQYGRASDGHEWRGSATTFDRATTPIPGTGSNSWDGKYILDNFTGVRDWLQTPDPTLWQGVNGQNNPCPAGYRIPTYAELIDLISTFTPNTGLGGGFNSPIKFTSNGSRSSQNGNGFNTNEGRYRSSTLSASTSSWVTRMTSRSNNQSNTTHISGYGVRCIKQVP